MWNRSVQIIPIISLTAFFTEPQAVNRGTVQNGCDFLVAVYIFENMIIFGTFFRFNP